MRNDEEMKAASAAEIADDTLRLLQAVMKDSGNVGRFCWKDTELTIRDRLDELVRRAESAPASQPHLKEKKKSAEEICVKTDLKPERMSLAMTPEVKEAYADFIKDKRTPYVYTSAALALFMKQYKNRTVRVLLEA